MDEATFNERKKHLVSLFVGNHVCDVLGVTNVLKYLDNFN